MIEARQLRQTRLYDLALVASGDSKRLRAFQAPPLAFPLGPHARPLQPLPFDASDGAIRTAASASAALCREVFDTTDDETEALARCWNVCRAQAIDPPALPDNPEAVDIVPALRRMSCPKWWRRRLRQAVARRTEGKAIREGKVQLRVKYIADDGEEKVREASYCSDGALWRRRGQQRRNRQLLDAIVMTNEEGDSFRLSELADKSLSNPQLRRNELMTRVKGLEDIAQARGDVGLFATLTLPSRFHAVNSKTGQINPTYMGQTPREGQQALCNVWAQCRALLHKADLRIYGLRVAEPHTDGTPHCHALIFCAEDEVCRVRQVLRDKALQDSGDEPGAQRHRATFERVDAAKGSATAYIAKYLAKNVDGHQLEVTLTRGARGELELSGDKPQTAAERIRAWASTWGIRQFQFFGSPPVCWWRELRRLPAGVPIENPVLEAAREPADAGEYSGHVRAAGGVCVPRKRLLLCSYAPTAESSASSKSVNCYGNLMPPRVIGVAAADGSGRVVTRLHEWTAAIQAREVGPAPWTCVNNCNRPEHQVGEVDLMKTRDFAWLKAVRAFDDWPNGPPDHPEP